MSSILKIEECEGYNKEEAFAHLNFDPNHSAIPGCNATMAWSKAGKPIPGSNKFKQFIIQQLDEKTKNVKGLGVYIVLKSPVKDTKKRPYTIINKKTEGTRHWTYAYFIQETELSVNRLNQESSDNKYEIEEYEDSETPQVKNVDDLDITILSRGPIVDIVDNKADALAKAKMLTTETHKDYTILVVQLPDTSPVAGYSIYTPSAGTKKGLWIAAGYEYKND